MQRTAAASTPHSSLPIIFKGDPVSDPVLAKRSIHAYTAEPVTDKLVEQLLLTAVVALSAGNQQP